MGLRIDTVTIDARDPQSLARWWAEALAYDVVEEEPDEIAVCPPGGAAGTTLLFVDSADAKTVKNRIHLDLRPDDRDAEVDRLVAMGARHVDIGQTGEETWVVLADPEGNELCILRSLP
jgi:hypothetical protein